ncbi:T6SS phospholipase effector Tle1-like catalytic domain-containing protein, partial [Pseudomonas aeruginosa]
MPNFGFHIAPTHPVAGRLIYDSKKLSENILKQQSDERVFSRAQEQKRLSEGDVVGGAPCCKAIHITLGFDGTNNNDKADGSSVSPSCSNVARLIHASIGSGDDINSRGIFKYYCPGVGTVFPDIKEFTPSNMGLIGAEGGENRINWGLVQLVDALFYTLLKSRLKLNDVQGLVEEMSTNWTVSTLTGGLLENGEKKRRAALEPKLKELEEKLRQRQNSGQKPHILAMRLYIYGFSRGAAEARAFANWLQELTRVSDADGRVEYRFAGLPISIEFLGLFDTVAAVGLADSAPFAAGHMDWADDTMRLPDEALSQCLPTILPEDCSFLKRCVHLVSCHEQRASFPLDSIRRRDMDANGRRTGPSCYRKWTVEYAYPGVHSDVGGGYGVGNQGKAVGGSEFLLSQIALQHMYAEAFEAGAPLQVPAPAVHPDFHEEWRVMVPKIEAEFSVSEELATRFNAWQAQAKAGPLEE